MMRLSLSLAFLALLASPPALAQTDASPGGTGAVPPEKKIVSLLLDLTDGTHLRTTPLFAALPLQTDLAKVDLPLDRVETITLSPDREQTRVRLRNGDQLTGALLQDMLSVTSLVGRLKIPLAAVQRISVLVSAGGEGPVGYWSFDDGTGKDSAGSNDATLVGPVSISPSPFGKALRLTSSRTYATSDATGVKGWSAISVSVWIKPRRYTTYGNVISRGSDSRPVYGLCLNPAAKGSFVVYTGPDGADGAGIDFRTFSNGMDSFPPVGRWYHLAGTYDGQTVRCFVNGELDGEAVVHTPGALLWDTEDARTYFGTSALLPYRNWGDQFFDGLLDEIKLWSRALSPAEVKALYQEGAGKLGTETDRTPDPETGLRPFRTR